MADAAKRGAFRQRVNAVLHSRLMPFWLVTISFLENSVLLVAMEPLFIPVMAARRKQAFFMAGLLTLGCVLGAAATYAVSAALFEPVVEPLMRFANVYNDYDAVTEEVKENGFWAMFFIGLTPFPFQLGTVAAGVVRMPVGDFVAAVALSRGLRYSAEAALVYMVGARAETLLEKYEAEIAVGCVILFGLLLAGGWLFSRLS